jgi:Uma2 family endonuclease
MTELAPSPLLLSEDEFDRLGAAGDASVRGRTELRRGMVIRMAPEHLPHGRFKYWLGKRLEAAIAAAGLDLVVDLDVTVRFAGHPFRPLPDVIVWDGGPLEGPIPGEKTGLCVEVSDSTLRDDKGDKRREYAEAGLAEYWVLDVRARALTRFWAPRGGDYADHHLFRAGETLASATLPLSMLFDPPPLS